jgi:hypothetical protein
MCSLERGGEFMATGNLIGCLVGAQAVAIAGGASSTSGAVLFGDGNRDLSTLRSLAHYQQKGTQQHAMVETPWSKEPVEPTYRKSLVRLSRTYTYRVGRPFTSLCKGVGQWDEAHFQQFSRACPTKSRLLPGNVVVACPTKAVS